MLFGGQALAKEWLAKVVASVADIPSAFAAAALLNLFTGLNDMCEGWTMDMARVICKLIWGDDYVLRPGTQHNPGLDPTYFLTHAAARFTTGSLIDLFGWQRWWRATLAYSIWSRGCRAWARWFNGGLGGYRGRLPAICPPGNRSAKKANMEPNGLLNGIADVIGYGANLAWDAGGYAAGKAWDAFATYADAWGAFKADRTR